ncbi:MAG: 1-deoxy-D-xylulose-5-phosphate reductoisomerase [Candidatus Aminicenantes bacterium]|nr:1-deoxy-D-xylulose-5-phosphate reductoisomerase [Candidatus Aminicenantes bacterium]
MKNVSILGSTGSIGRNTLQVIEHLSDKFNIVGLAAGKNTKLLKKQVEKFKPKVVSLERTEDAQEIMQAYSHLGLRVVSGREGAEEIAQIEDNDIVVCAITGINGLLPTLAAVKAGKRVALANKESMVVAGSLLKKEANRTGAEIIPVDSEHSGVFQCLVKENRENIKRVILTASGGPFFRTPKEDMQKITLEEALNHPRWKMGAKVTIDSATLMNKGLELIEAKWLFDLHPQQLEILIHPQSIVHSLVEMKDGSVLAQMSTTDMRIPIQYALTYPQREKAPVASLDLSQIQSLDFFEVDTNKFPLIKIARLALKEGGSFPVALNAANEEVVDAFLKKKLRFSEVYDVIREAVEAHDTREVNSIEEIFQIDREIKMKTRKIIEQRC